MAQVQVKSGDSLWKIAKANPKPGVSITDRIREIAAASGISDPNAIKPGQVLIVPGGQDAPSPRTRPDPAAISAARQMDTRGPIPRSNAAARPEPMTPAPQPRQLGPVRPQVTPDFRQSMDLANDMNTTRENTEWWQNGEGALRPQASPPPAPPSNTPPIGNLSEVSMSDALMNPARFPDPMSMTDTGAETPVADAMTQGPAIIGPQFTPETFAETPSGMGDSELQALLADPQRRQMLIQALMQPGGGM